MPLAHPQTITTTDNYDEPCAAVAFATSTPGEGLKDFQDRISDVGVWGQFGVGRQKVELVLTRESADELIRLLLPLVGKT